MIRHLRLPPHCSYREKIMRKIHDFRGFSCASLCLLHCEPSAMPLRRCAGGLRFQEEHGGLSVHQGQFGSMPHALGQRHAEWARAVSSARCADLHPFDVPRSSLCAIPLRATDCILVLRTHPSLLVGRCPSASPGPSDAQPPPKCSRPRSPRTAPARR